jgi:hypothetical protein
MRDCDGEGKLIEKDLVASYGGDSRVYFKTNAEDEMTHNSMCFQYPPPAPANSIGTLIP